MLNMNDILKEREQLIIAYKEKKNNIELYLNSLPKEFDLRKCYCLGKETIDYINSKNGKWSWYDAFIIDKRFFSRKYYIELKWSCVWNVGSIVDTAGSNYYNHTNKLEHMKIESLKRACSGLDILKSKLQRDITDRI